MSKKTILILGAALAVVTAVLLLKTTVIKPATVAAAGESSVASETPAPASAETPAPAVNPPAKTAAAASGASQSSSILHPPSSSSSDAGPALVPGEMVTARVAVNGQTQDLTPDQVGAFPKVLIDPRQKVSVTASWPDGQPGQKVVVAAEDGGQVADAKHPVGFTLDARRQVTFDFTADSNPGIYRVTLRKGADVKTVQFWAGPELALKNPQ